MGSELDELLERDSKAGKHLARAKAAEARAKALEKLLATQQEQIEQLTAKRFALNPGKAKPTKGSFVRVVMGDSHGCFQDDGAVKAMLRDLASLAPREIVLGGDHLDCAGWMARHHPFKTVQEARYSFSEDVDAANTFLDAVQKAAPGAKMHMLEGNHEERIEAWVVEQTQGNTKDAAYLRQMFSPEAVMHTEARGIPYYRRTQSYGGLRVRGCVKLGCCHFVHGMSHAKHAADVHLAKLKANVVFFHTHRPQQASTADTMTEMAAYNPGCLCVLEPMWKHSAPTEWGHGYGVQFVRPNGHFLHINVPIIDGESYLIQLTERIK